LLENNREQLGTSLVKSLHPILVSVAPQHKRFRRLQAVKYQKEDRQVGFTYPVHPAP
jgi:hypothetical protein